MNHESFFDPETPSALSALATEYELRKNEFATYQLEVKLRLEQTTLDQTDREWLDLDYARVSFTRMAYELNYIYRLLEFTQDDADQADFEQLDARSVAVVTSILEVQRGMREAGVDVNGILDQYNLGQYKIIDRG